MGSKDNEKAVEEDYKVALTNLHVNSKPIITFLTMLADENKAHAPIITRVVAKHIKEVSFGISCKCKDNTKPEWSIKNFPSQF